MQRELNCVWMRCGAACGQGLRTQRSLRVHFLLSAPSLPSTQNLLVIKKRVYYRKERAPGESVISHERVVDVGLLSLVRR